MLECQNFRVGMVWKGRTVRQHGGQSQQRAAMTNLNPILKIDPYVVSAFFVPHNVHFVILFKGWWSVFWLARTI
jgi:hypothetical protein